MRLLRMTILLALTGLVWKRFLQPNLPAAKAKLAKTRQRVEPRIRKVTDGLRSASQDAAESVRDLSLSAAEAAEAARDASLSVAGTAESVATAVGESGTDPGPAQ